MSIAPIWTTLIDFLFIFLLVKLIQHSGLIWTRYGGIFIKSCAYFFFFYIHISCEYCRITCAKMWFYGQKRSTTWQHFCILRIESVWIQKQQQKQPWTHVLFLPSQWCLSPAHMFPQTGMHTHTRSGNTDIRGGAFWHADQGQQGLYDLWHCPTGHWALTAYATAPTYREINPHFISHICSTASKQTDSKTTKKTADVWLKKFQNWSIFGKRLYFLVLFLLPSSSILPRFPVTSSLTVDFHVGVSHYRPQVMNGGVKKNKYNEYRNVDSPQKDWDEAPEIW